MSNKQYFVYIVASISRVLYVGMTGDLQRRVFEHKKGTVDGFTKRYHVHKLVYYEAYNDVWDAIARETQIKDYRREKKIALIERENSLWHDLAAAWYQ